MSSVAGPPPIWPRELSLRFPGFHLRHFTWPGKWPGGAYWTFALSPIYPMLLTAIPPALWAALVFRRRNRLAARLCPRCAYNLIANTTGICPECGTPIPRELKTKE